MAKSVQKALQNLQKTIQTESKKIVRQTTEEIASDARSLAPGAVASTISTSHADGTSTIEVNHHAAAYIEFGTGGNVFQQYIPSESDDIIMYKDYASEFYKTGKGRTLQQPFLFPAFFRSRDLFASKLAKAIEDSFK